MITMEWRPVAGIEDRYQISDTGQVYSLRRHKVMSPAKGDCGHLRVSLWDGERYHHRYVHHLVLEAFEGPCPPGMECLHANDISNDNSRENLRWGTRSENRQDAIANGRDHNANKTRCPQDHEYTEENTYITYSHPKGPYRICKICLRDRQRRWRAKVKQ